MYDILQLNDMLVPELLDIAEQLNIPNSNKLDKQDLVYQILDKQAVMNSNKPEEAKPKRKRIVKASTANSTEDAEVMQEKPKPEPKQIKRTEPIVEKRKPVKKEEPIIDEEEELQPLTEQDSTIPPAIASLLQEEDTQQDLNFDDNIPQGQPAKQYLQRREQNPPAFNIEFDGIILGEGVFGNDARWIWLFKKQRLQLSFFAG
ncbi:MAG: Rho termination factor N-terminal domain-containing protein [Ferruginibacter sp.]